MQILYVALILLLLLHFCSLEEKLNYHTLRFLGIGFERPKMKAFFVFVCIVSFSFAAEDAELKNLVVTNVERDLDLTTQLVKETLKIEVENNDNAAAKYFVLAINPEMSKHVAHVEAFTQKGDDKHVLKSDKTSVKGKKQMDLFYKIEFATPVNAKQKLKFSVVVVYTHILKPFPSHILQKDQQFIVYEGNQYVYNAYLTTKQTTTVKLSPGTLENYSKLQPVKQDGTTLTYGPYENVEAFKSNELRIHYENNNSFLVVTKMTRLLEVSHWGNIAVEETVEIVHTGAVLKGSFSRFDFQRDQRGNDKQPCIKSFRTILPTSARDVYYRDEIGNISTSHLRQSEDAVDLEIRPRFPLFGGWKTNYYIGYNVPSYEYLFSSGNNFALKMRFIDHIYDNFVVDELDVKIILPEGAKDFKFIPPYPVKRLPDEVHYTYLDVTGRPVIVAHKENLAEEHIQDFELHYTFDRLTMIREPLMIVVSFYILFFIVIVYVRLDFTIAKDQAVEGKLKVAGLMEQVTDLHSQRMSSYDSLIDVVNKFRNNKEQSVLTAGKKKFENDSKELTQNLTNLQALLKAENQEYGEKINELNRLDRQARDQLLLTLIPSVEKLVSGKLNKAQFSDAEKACRQKLDECKEKMDNIVYAL